MKKYFLLQAFVLLFVSGLWAQDAAPVAALKVGERVPDAFWTSSHSYFDKGRAVSGSLAPMRGRLLILDFWATYCSPCISMFPVTDSLKRLFGDALNFVPVTDQKEGIVGTFLQNHKKGVLMGSEFRFLYGESDLEGYFPHYFLPHYVWISADGKVLAITGAQEVTGPNIRRALRGDPGLVHTKSDPSPSTYDKFSAMLGRNSGDTTKVIFHSVLTAYQDGISKGHAVLKFGEMGRITVRNCSVSDLYRFAFTEGSTVIDYKKTEYRVRDRSGIVSLKVGQELDDWGRAGNEFCYEFVFPWSMVKSAHLLMREDLRRYFPQYSASLEGRTVACLALVRTSVDTALFASKGAKGSVSASAFAFDLVNVPIQRMIAQLRADYLKSVGMEILNETGYRGRVDLSLRGELTDVDTVNLRLLPYGLKLIRVEREKPVLVISDSDPGSAPRYLTN